MEQSYRPDGMRTHIVRFQELQPQGGQLMLRWASRPKPKKCHGETLLHESPRARAMPRARTQIHRRQGPPGLSLTIAECPPATAPMLACHDGIPTRIFLLPDRQFEAAGGFGRALITILEPHDMTQRALGVRGPFPQCVGSETACCSS